MTQILNDAQINNIKEKLPTVNKFYLMLHKSKPNVHNQNLTTLNSFDIPILSLSSVKLNNNLNDSPSTLTNNSLDVCCYDYTNNDKVSVSDYDLTTTVDLSNDGAKIEVSELIKHLKSQSGRRKRIVSVVRTLDEGNVTRIYQSTVSLPSPPSVSSSERRRKPGETGSSAPLLNYIFDTYSNTHPHHNRNDR